MASPDVAPTADCHDSPVQPIGGIIVRLGDRTSTSRGLMFGLSCLLLNISL